MTDIFQAWLPHNSQLLFFRRSGILIAVGNTPESHLKGEKQLFEGLGLGLGLGLWSETNGSHVWNVSKANA